MKTSVLIALMLTAASSSALAQSAFEGAYGQLGIGYDNNKINSYTGLGDGVDVLSVDSASGSSFSGVVGLGYNFSVTPQYLLGLGADYGMISSSVFTSVNANGEPGNKVSNRYNIFIAPGYIIDKDRLVYLKVGYSRQSVKITDQTAGSDTLGQTIGNGSAEGYVLGFGYKQLIQNGLYGFAEGNYYNYSSLSSGTVTLTTGYSVSNANPKSSAYQFLVGLGYKF